GVFQVKTRKPDPPPLPGQTAKTRPGRKPAMRSAALVWVVSGLIVFVSLGLAVVAVNRPGVPPKRAGPEPYRSTEHNYSFLMPGPPWERDNDLAKRLGGVLAFHRNDADARVVLAVRNYPKYVPALAELR